MKGQLTSASLFPHYHRVAQLSPCKVGNESLGLQVAVLQEDATSASLKRVAAVTTAAAVATAGAAVATAAAAAVAAVAFAEVKISFYTL